MSQWTYATRTPARSVKERNGRVINWVRKESKKSPTEPTAGVSKSMKKVGGNNVGSVSGPSVERKAALAPRAYEWPGTVKKKDSSRPLR